ncbi:MAG: roadblock/LC7 domain-containing protein [Myxococcales bacterium]|nr:roadblock/LC7 domain-containing protein [Myxococcales bacterium]
MRILEGLLAIPGVSSAVLGTTEGGLLGSVDEGDAEILAAVAGFAVTSMSDGAEHLGFGEFRELRVQGPAGNTLIVSDQRLLMIVRLESKAQPSKVAEALRELLQTEVVVAP